MKRVNEADIVRRRMDGKQFRSGGKPVVPVPRMKLEPAPVAPAPAGARIAEEALVAAAEGITTAATLAAESAMHSMRAAEEVAAGIADLAIAVREKKRWRCVVGRDKEGKISYVDINQA